MLSAIVNTRGVSNWVEHNLPISDAELRSEDLGTPRHDLEPIRQHRNRAAFQFPAIARLFDRCNGMTRTTIAMDSVRRPRFFAWAMGLFAVAAVALSVIAVYAVLTLEVVQRRPEIGIRTAIGARPGRIGASILGRAVALGAIGMTIGLSVARALSRYIESLLTEVTPTDTLVYAGAAVAILVLASLAACVPVWRAVHIDPVGSLRAEG